MFNFDDITNKNNESHKKKWPYIPDHPYRMLIIGGSGFGKRNALLNLIKEQDSDELIDKNFCMLKTSMNENISEEVGMYLNNPKAFIEYSNISSHN